METFCDLRKKEVINLCDGCRLGFVDDLVIDLKTGRIEKIIVPVGNRCWGLLASGEEFVIPWECIRKIGDDIILVEVKSAGMRREV